MKGKGWQAGRDQLLFIFSLLSSCTCRPLGTLDFCCTLFYCHIVHEWTQHLNMSSMLCMNMWVNVKQGFSLRRSALPTSRIGALSPFQCVLFFVSTFRCHIVCTACYVMKGQSSGKRGSRHGNKVLNISTYLAALKASGVKLVSHL